MEKYRRIDLKLKFSFNEDVDKIRTIITNTLAKHPKVNKNLEIDVWLDEIGEYELKVVARCWVESIDYWPIYWEQLEAVKNELNREGIKIPLPSRVIYQGDEEIKK